VFVFLQTISINIKKMVLAIDIGNTNIVIGLFDGTKWAEVWRLESGKTENLLFYSYKINDFLWEAGIDVKDIDLKVVSTVVPELKDLFVELLENLNDSKLVVLDKNIYHKLDIVIDNPNEIGTDLVANAVAAHRLYAENVIVVDFGTALTFTVINKEGQLVGVNIAPGVKTAINALVGNTAQLPKVDLVMPLNPIGKNTIEAIQNGELIGYVGLVKYMIKVINSHLQEEHKVVVTGGLAQVIAPHVGEVDYIEPNLTLYGLKFVGELF